MTHDQQWEHFSHDADIGIRGYGPSLEKAFEQAAYALTAVMTNPQTITSTEKVDIVCEAPSEELLFVDWLNALIYEMATRSMLFNEFSVRLNGLTLLGTAWGELVNVSRHQPAVEIKGATYTALRVSCNSAEMWIAQCVVDV